MTPLTTLLDLKSLLVEAKQKIPQFLADLDLEEDQDNLASETGTLYVTCRSAFATEPGLTAVSLKGVIGCAYCGGLGHRIGNCPKLEQTRMKTLRGVTSGGSARERGGGGY
jgi:ATP-dependent RNA helicase DDX41